MKAAFIISLLAILASCKTSVQRPISVNLIFTRPAFVKIDSIELANNGLRIYAPYKISVSKNYFPNADKFRLGTPLLFVRDTSTISTAVTYFFSEPDSVIRLVEYSWNRGKDKNEIERLFNFNDSAISKQLRNQGIKTLNKKDTWSQVTKIWTSDSVYVKQFMLIEGAPSRTRVLISWNH
ncbi:hypothetical protein WG954_00760 [Lacibacter sp. H375]|uniref:hypothetical protein n=1 Tax=Lacibacter sp. H375 TaxID=3133424 RepID=UPI0030BB8B79